MGARVTKVSISVKFSFFFIFIISYLNCRNVQEPLILILVGNKNDLNETRAVSREEAFLYATSIGGNYFESSTINDQGIEQVFTATALGLIRLADRRGCYSMKRYDSYESLSTVFGDGKNLLVEKDPEAKM